MIPHCGGPKPGYNGDSRRGYGERILVRIVLGGQSSACFELFSGGHISSTDESTPERKERFGEFGILRR
jgi:hypothetical protein